MSETAQYESSTATKHALDLAWQITRETRRRDEAMMLSSPALLFALCDLTRSGAFARSLTTRFLRRAFADSWSSLAVHRTMFVTAGAHQEAASERGRLSEPAAGILRLSRLLALDRGGAGGLRLRDLALALLLYPDTATPVAAQDILRSAGHAPWQLALQLQRFEPAQLQPPASQGRAPALHQTRVSPSFGG